MEFKFGVPSTIQYGRGCSKGIGAFLKELDVKNVLMVYDQGIFQAGLTGGIREGIEQAGMSVEVYDKVEPNPTDISMSEGAALVAKAEIDAIVAIGGGSSMDCAKGIRILASNPAPIGLYEGFEQVKHKQKILVCVPTTSGTSSELTNVCIVSDTAQERKYIVAGKNVGADYAFVDPNMMDGLPARVTADTGLDALTHAIESYISLAATPLTAPLSLTAAQLIYQNLPRAVLEKGCKEARDNMALACVIVGCAFPNAGNGLVHAISHALGAHCHLAHGTACAVTLPYVLDFNYPCAKKQCDTLAETLAPGSGKTLREIVYDLERQIGIPTLKECGIAEEQLEFLAEESMKEDFGPNPNRAITKEAILEILKKAYHG